ncbi:TPA: hypothetical protein I8235_003230 [Kluyvera intermedia]|nr:hypothetical protein [Kluyvera intermedia]
MKDETLLPDERTAFEKFMDDYFGNSVDRRRVKNGDGEYMTWDMQVAWIVWKKRAAIQCGNSGQVPVGYVLVSAEPTVAILDEIDAIFDFGAEDSKDAWHRLLAAAPKSPGSQLTPAPGWTDNSDANAALVMLDRIDTLDPADDDRIEEIKQIIRSLAAPKVTL